MTRRLRLRPDHTVAAQAEAHEPQLPRLARRSCVPRPSPSVHTARLGDQRPPPIFSNLIYLRYRYAETVDYRARTTTVCIRESRDHARDPSNTVECNIPAPLLDTTILRVVPRVNAAVIACHPHPAVHRVVQAAGRIGTTIPVRVRVVAGRPLQYQSKGAPGRRQSKLCSDHRSTAACIGEARPPRWQALAWTARARQLPVAHEVGCRRPRSPRVGVGRDPNREAPQCPRCGICVRNASSPRGDLRQGRRRGRRGAR
jgi:hypothetical protein